MRSLIQPLVLGLLLGSLYGLVAVGIVLVYKATRVLNFAQAEFGTFATYIAWLLIMKLNQPWIIGALVALVTIGLIGFLAERFVIRPMLEGPRLSIAVATLGLMSLLGFAEIRIWTASPQVLRSPFPVRGLDIAGILVSPVRLTGVVVAVLIGIALFLFVHRTTFGLGLLASSQDPVAVRLMGIKMKHLSSFTWVTASVIGGIAGLLIVTSLGGSFSPFFVTFALFVPSLAAALIGGMTSIPGSFIGGAAIGLLQTLLRHFAGTVPGIEELGVFVVLLALLLFRPQGLFGKVA